VLGSGAATVRSQYGDLILEPRRPSASAESPRGDEVLRAIKAVPGVARRSWPSSCTHTRRRAIRRAGGAAELLSRPERGPHRAAKPYWFFVAADAHRSPQRDTHGTMYGYDQHVPIILYGSGNQAGEYTRPVTPADIARRWPTCAA